MVRSRRGLRGSGEAPLRVVEPVAAERAVALELVEVAFPAWPAPLRAARAVALAAPREWALEREAGRAAFVVGAVVGVPAAIAVGTVLTVFVVGTAVVLAPALAVGLAWLAWRGNARARPQPGA